MPDQRLSHLTCDVTDSAADRFRHLRGLGVNGREGAVPKQARSGHTEHWEKDIVRGIDTSTLRWKVCRDDAWEGDECSDWRMHAVGPNGSSIELQCQLTRSNPTCYLPDNGSGSNPPSANCLYSITATAVGIAGAKGGEILAAKVSARLIPGAGWAVTVIGAGQGVCPESC